MEDADGGKYDFMEVGLYNILKDKDITLNTKMERGANNATVNTEAGLTLGDRTVHVKADGTVMIGYTDPAIKAAPVSLADGQTLTLAPNRTITRAGNKITAHTGEYKVLIDTQLKFGAMQYLDIDIWSKAGGVLSDSVAPTGLLGETFDADNTPQAKPKQDVNAYQQDNLFKIESKPTPPAPTPAVAPTPAAAPTPAQTPNTTPTPVQTTPPPVTPPAPGPVQPPAVQPDPMLQLQQMFQQLMAMFLQLFGSRGN